jgi:hypothetical protein
MKKYAKVISLVMLFMLLTATAAMAVTATVEFKPGPFSMGSMTVNSFGDVNLTGQDQYIETTINDFQVVDARGNNKGWIVRVSATPFQDGSGNMLHEGALKISGLSVRSVGNSDVVDSSCVIADNLSVTSIPQNLVYMPESRGKGTYEVSGTRLTLEAWPKEVLATSYTATLTFELITNVK